MNILRQMRGLGIALLIVNEIRGILVVVALLSGGAQALAQQAPDAGRSAPTAHPIASGF